MTARSLFTRNQRDVIDRMVQGKLAREVADDLRIDVSNVQGAIKRARQRVGARNNMELVAIAVTSGEVRPPRLLGRGKK